MNCKHSIFLWLFLPIWGFSQMKISGVVLDEFKDPIPYCDVFIPGTDYYISTNTDGSFYLETLENYTELQVQQYGYIDQMVPLNNPISYNLTIVLKDADENKELKEVLATSMKKYKNKKENPAYQILREIWKRKKTNGLKKYDNFEYEEYEKIEFDLNNLDSAFIHKKIFKGLDFVFNNIDTSSITGKNFLPMFLNESIYKVIGENRPNTRFKRNLIANKSSGFDDNEIVSQTVKNMYKDFDFYNNRLNFFNKAFISPIARDGFANYDYNIIDTTMVDDKRHIRIKYFPKRDNEFTFKGDFVVIDSIFTIESANMQSTKGINVNFVRDIYAELNYKFINDSIYVPESSYIMLDMSLLTKKNHEKGMFAHKTNSYQNYQFEIPDINPKITEKVNPYETNAFDKSNEFWEQSRHFKLSETENDIYKLLDTLQHVKKFKNVVNIFEIMGSGYINFYDIWDLGYLYSTFGYNDIEGIRLRMGGRTYLSKNDMWRLGGYLAYGFKDDKFKYGAELRYMFNTDNRFTMGVGTKRDIEQLGAQLTTQDGILTRSFASSSLFARGDNSLLSNNNKTNVFMQIDPWTNFSLRLDANFQSITTANPNFSIDFIDQNGQQQSETKNTSYSFSIITKPYAKYSQMGIDRYEHSTLSPIIVARYTKALDGVFHSQFNYDKIDFYFYQPKLWGSIGRSDITLEAGKLFGKAPITLLSVIPGNQSYSIVPGTFSQINYYEFVTDTYFSFSIDHHFNGRFFSYIPLLKKLNLREVAFIRTAWGEISRKNSDMNRSSIIYKAPHDKLYYEYGFGVENIGIGNIRFFRIDFNWRGNYLQDPNVTRFGVKFGFNLTF